MKNIFSFLIFIFLLSFQNTYAEKISAGKANEVAIHFLNSALYEINNIELSEPVVLKQEGHNILYVFNFTNGFVLISAESSVFPVLGYSAVHPFEFGMLPPSFEFWLNSYKEQIFWNIKNNEAAPRHIAQAWENLTEKSRSSQLDNQFVSPMLQTSWNQGCYYNSALPVDSSGSCNHPYTGCVATALGQVLKYYNYPKTGTGSNGIATPYGWLEVQFDETNYDWVSMENNLTTENPAVAELLLHCVVGVNSQFLPGGTGAYDSDARDALINYFGYEENAQFLWRDSYSGDWPQLLRDELQQGRPVIYGGVEQESGYGHTFICDGYQDSVYFHINWGWGGLFNGYFYIDTLIGGNYHYNYLHDVIVGIKPDIEGPEILYPVENLSAQTEFHDINLSWDEPSISSSLELLGYNVFRNDSLLNNSIITGLNYSDMDVPPGNHEYLVKTSYIGNGSGPAASTEIYVSGIITENIYPFNVYPNPVSSKLYIEQPDFYNKSFQIVLMNNIGQVVNSEVVKDLNRNFHSINCENLSPGTYILSIEAGYLSFTKKILIK
ncbi:MAG: thiol protease/hemagglutinin PrtT [Bacteroidales bacterium]|nr:thiol protease/hemagglutinin PrtT [Bacteroidales bacterium]